MSDDAKKAILARRARFVAAALAGIGIACGKDPAPPPQPCLSQPYNPPDASAPPEPCLSVEPTPVDAGPQDTGAPETSTSSSTTTQNDAKDAATPPPPPPHPCLSVKPPPTVCLKVAPPKQSK